MSTVSKDLPTKQEELSYAAILDNLRKTRIHKFELKNIAAFERLTNNCDRYIAACMQDDPDQIEHIRQLRQLIRALINACLISMINRGLKNIPPQHKVLKIVQLLIETLLPGQKATITLEPKKNTPPA